MANTSGEDAAEGPLPQTVAGSIEELLALGSERGYVTYDELSATLPLDQLSSEEIEDTMTMLSELGITVTESDESEEPVAPEGEPAKARGNLDHDDIGRTDDPVRMYLREMRSVQLLSREGEVAIAKRIEAGREMMLGAIRESPLTFGRAPALPLGGQTHELSSHRVDLDEVSRDVVIAATLPGYQAEAAARECRRWTCAAQMNYRSQLLPLLTADFHPSAMAKNRCDVPVQEHRRKLRGMARHDPRI